MRSQGHWAWLFESERQQQNKEENHGRGRWDFVQSQEADPTLTERPAKVSIMEIVTISSRF